VLDIPMITTSSADEGHTLVTHSPNIASRNALDYRIRSWHAQTLRRFSFTLPVSDDAGIIHAIREGQTGRRSWRDLTWLQGLVRDGVYEDTDY